VSPDYVATDNATLLKHNSAMDGVLAVLHSDVISASSLC